MSDLKVDDADVVETGFDSEPEPEPEPKPELEPELEPESTTDPTLPDPEPVDATPSKATDSITRPIQPVQQFPVDIPRERLRSRTSAKVRATTPKPVSVKPVSVRSRASASPAPTLTPTTPPRYQGLYNDRIYMVNLFSFEAKITAVLLLVIAYLWIYCPTQPVSQDVARAIVHGCTFDGSTKILCTHEGCFRNPVLYDTGPTSTDSYKKLPEYVVVRHTTGWLFEGFATLRTHSAIKCVSDLFQTPSSP
jgi:hypothetical protein